MRKVTKRMSKTIVNICAVNKTHEYNKKKIAPKEAYFEIAYDLGKGGTVICFDCYNHLFAEGLIKEGVYLGKPETKEANVSSFFPSEKKDVPASPILSQEEEHIPSEITLDLLLDSVPVPSKLPDKPTPSEAQENPPKTHLFAPHELRYQEEGAKLLEGKPKSLEGFVLIPLEQIKITEANHRDIDPQKFEDFKESIRLQGVLTPILITDTYELIAGYHRVQAAKDLNMTSIPARIIPVKNKTQHHVISIIENFQRNDLNDYEKAKAIELLKERTKATTDDLAQLLGYHRRTILRYTKLLKAPKAVQKAVRDKKLTMADVNRAKEHVEDLAEKVKDKTPERAQEIKAQLFAEMEDKGNIFTQTYKLAEKLESNIIEIAKSHYPFNPEKGVNMNEVSELVQLLDNRVISMIHHLSQAFACHV